MKRARAVAAAGGLLLVAAFVFDAAPLFVPGAAFLLAGVVTPAWLWLSLRRARVRRRFTAREVVERQAVEAVVSIRRGVLGLPGAELHDPMSPDPVRLLARPSLLARRDAEIRLAIRFERRGHHRVAGPYLAVSDPLGLARLTRRGSGGVQELLVLPRTEPVTWLGASGARQQQSPDPGIAEESLAAVDVDGLRPYRQGTPATRIHWPALARGQGLLERQLQADVESRPLVVLDVRGAEDGPALDAAVRAAASLTLELGHHGGCRLLLPGDTRPAAVESDLRGWPALHTRLALVSAEHATVPPLTGISGGGAVFYVALRATRRLPPSLSGGRGALRALVLPRSIAPEAGGAPAFAVSGCDGYVLSGGAGAAAIRRRVGVGAS